jgi:hypothetical protein
VNNTFHIILSNVKEAIKLIGMQKWPIDLNTKVSLSLIKNDVVSL